MFNTRTRKLGRSSMTTRDRWWLRNRSVKSKLQELNSRSWLVTYITWSRPKPFLESITRLSWTSSLKPSTSKLSNIWRVHSKWTMSGSHLTRRRLSSSVLCPRSNRKWWSSRNSLQSEEAHEGAPLKDKNYTAEWDSKRVKRQRGFDCWYRIIVGDSPSTWNLILCLNGYPKSAEKFVTGLIAVKSELLVSKCLIMISTSHSSTSVFR